MSYSTTVTLEVNSRLLETAEQQAKAAGLKTDKFLRELLEAEIAARRLPESSLDKDARVFGSGHPQAYRSGL